ncbi:MULTISPECIES: hypothetical protein [Acinetobacter]|uniref:Uncharacterized protein n=1 Tax=Acinetobacter pseudolwoffii TaxID=2053287 RepID=A0A2H9YQB0_9GAMM|nr:MULTISPECIES: hypothetical protein [Acinetobacter]ENW23534.1 hypothetical protein F925_02492 [Acinetobacter lwoffii NCTC 5866 = CIP 64.10 = NIPH 512]NLZ87607.1 hypothetical protein [Gammaproteobacteria bacterium]MDH5819416.1 hypothetical protein [Acinetobacter pseudolwoffii]MDM1325322.1 hypothetical protein [Acinetobacter pseudolwoffii]MDM1340425.1 hypothetical protein [Acinetobacter pseudolwoffii]
MVQLIKKGGLRERANRSRSYQGSENTETSLRPNRYQTAVKTQENLVSSSLISTESTLDDHPVNSSK